MGRDRLQGAGAPGIMPWALQGCAAIGTDLGDHDVFLTQQPFQGAALLIPCCGSERLRGLACTMQAYQAQAHM